MADSAPEIGRGEGPLGGLLVVDFTTNLPGPMCTQKLAWIGATVVKIEPPGGDPTRHTYGGNMYELTNAGKLVATLDLKSASDRDLARKLCARADVVVESFRPGVAERLGVGYKYVNGVNPDAVYCSMPGYGSATPQAQDASHDLTLLAESGAIGLPGTWRDRDTDAPSRPSLPVVDIAAAESAVQAILAALLGRHRGCAPPHIEVPLAEPIRYWSAVRGTSLAAAGSTPFPPYLDPANDLYRCEDGEWVAVSAIETKFWALLCDEMSLAESRPGAGMESWDWRQRQQHGPRLQKQIETWVGARPRPDVLDRLGGRGIPVAPVMDPAALFDELSAHDLARQPPTFFNSCTTLPPAAVPDAHADIIRRLAIGTPDWTDETDGSVRT